MSYHCYNAFFIKNFFSVIVGCNRFLPGTNPLKTTVEVCLKGAEQGPREDSFYSRGLSSARCFLV